MADQRTDDWYQARLGKVTGSRVIDVMKGERLAGWKNYKAELLIERLTGQPTESFTSRPMQWGIDYEDTARLLYTLKTKNSVEEVGFVKEPKREFGASPDGLVGKDGLVEIKCPNTATMIDTLKTGKIPPQYYAQMQAQMYVTGRKWCDYVSFDPRLPTNARLYIERVKRDEEYIKTMLSFVDKFLNDLEKDMEFIKTYKGGSGANKQRGGAITKDSQVPVPQAQNGVRKTPLKVN